MRVTFDELYPATHEKIAPGDTATGIDTDTSRPPGTHSVRFTSGGTHEVLVGDTLTGATSGKTAVVRGIVLEGGTWAGGDAYGVFYLDDPSGAFQAENLNEGANSNVCTISGDLLDITWAKNKRAQKALITCEAQTAMISYNGEDPTQTPTFVGHELPADMSILLETSYGVRTFKCIDKTSGSNATLKVTCYFSYLGQMHQTE